MAWAPRLVVDLFSSESEGELEAGREVGIAAALLPQDVARQAADAEREQQTLVVQQIAELHRRICFMEEAERARREAQCEADAAMARRLQEEEEGSLQRRRGSQLLLADEALAWRLHEEEEAKRHVVFQAAPQVQEAQASLTQHQRGKTPASPGKVEEEEQRPAAAADGSRPEKRRRTAAQILRGKCRCGVLSFRLPACAGPPVLRRCHCQHCRRAHGAPWITLLCLEGWQAAELRSQLEQGLRHSPPRYCDGQRRELCRSFCSKCGSIILVGSSGAEGCQEFLATGGLQGLGSPWERPQVLDLSSDRAPFYQSLPRQVGRAPRMGRGACSCGKFRWAAAMPRCLDLWHCHCKTCQHWSGADLQSWVMLSRSKVTWEATDTLEVVKSSLHAKRGHCGVCGSTVGMEYISQPETVFLAAGAFDVEVLLGYNNASVSHHDIFEKSAPPWSPVRIAMAAR
jgi:hypothetical protein